MLTRAADYERGAVWFADRAAALTEEARWIRRSLPPNVLSGGPVRTALDDTLGVTIQNLARVARALEHLADESRRRAAVCREFEWMLRRHDRALDAWLATPTHERWSPRPAAPVPPARWVMP